MTCFLQLEDGSGSLRLEDGTGNLQLEFCAEDIVLLGGTPAGPNVNPNAANYHYEAPYDTYKREQEEKVSKKQDTVIKLKLESQDNLLRQKEISAQSDKQSKRQMKALEREQSNLMSSIQAAMDELTELTVASEIQQEQQRRLAVIDQNNEAFIIMLAADPFFGLGGSMH